VSSLPTEAKELDQEALEVFELIRPVSEQWRFSTASVSAFMSVVGSGLRPKPLEREVLSRLERRSAHEASCDCGSAANRRRSRMEPQANERASASRAVRHSARRRSTSPASASLLLVTTSDALPLAFGRKDIWTVVPAHL